MILNENSTCNFVTRVWIFTNDILDNVCMRVKRLHTTIYSRKWLSIFFRKDTLLGMSPTILNRLVHDKSLKRTLDSVEFLLLITNRSEWGKFTLLKDSILPSMNDNMTEELVHVVGILIGRRFLPLDKNLSKKNNDTLSEWKLPRYFESFCSLDKRTKRTLYSCQILEFWCSVKVLNIGIMI